jgi:zinc transporter, ZIP family
VTFAETALLSGIAGITIYLGLPVGRLRALSPRTQTLLTAAAAGVILFLLYDILAQAVGPIEAALEAARAGEGPVSTFVIDATVGMASLGVGLLSIVWLTSRVRNRRTMETAPRDVALGTAVGLGFHNLSEGLAIGQSAGTGATALALVLVIGFALHNATEGFGIAAPLTTDDTPSWRFLGALGLLGGGPTFVGGLIGYTFTSDLLSIVFLGLAAGALIYVFNEMMAVCRRLAQPIPAGLSLLAGLFVAFATDFVLIAVGA